MMASSPIALLLRYAVVLCGALLCWVTIGSFALFISTQHPLAYLNYHRPLPQYAHQHSYIDGLFLWPILINLMLIFIFILQHIVMATDWWKTDISPAVLGRSLYVWGTSAALGLLMWGWHPIGGAPLWYIDTSERSLLWLLFCVLHSIAWFLIFITTFSMDIGELIGFSQVYNHHYGHPPPLQEKSQDTQRLYRHMRHGGATCLLVVLWVHPMMTASRLLLACLLSAFMCGGFSVRKEDHEFVQRTHHRWKTGSVHMEYHYEVVS